MNNPIKIIHKFKNNNRRIQYIVYVYIGNLVNENILNILENIKNKNLYDTLNLLSKNKLEEISQYYGEYWYNCFFNTYHIKDQKNNILKNSNKKKQIIDKFGKEWFQKHFETEVSKKEYSFAANYYDYLVARNKIKTKIKKKEMDFTTYQTGGGDNIINEDNIDDKLEEENDEDTDVVIKSSEDLDDNVVEDFNLEELTKLYSMDDIENDKSIKETAKLISEATKDKSWLKTDEVVNTKFDTSLEDLQYDTKLEDIYAKTYIFDEFIFKDDTITTLRNKVCVSLPYNNKFNNINILPEYQYFWTEYNLNNKTDSIMLGQKWIRRNELLKIDIKPNTNLNVYENLRNNLSYLKESFGVKIKREDDESNIIRDYDEYMTNNEIYMIDILNELGINYNSEAEKKKNLYEVYVNIYFPFITFERFENLINLLTNKEDIESEKNVIKFNSIKNDTKLESQIYELVEETKKNKKAYSQYFDETYILQTIIHLNLKNDKNITGTVSSEKFDLYKIFDSFIVNETYPFIQYQTPDSQLTYKFFTKTQKIDDKNILSKWFDNAPYGISFKIKVEEEKFISINFNENGRIEYKITWTEDNKATIDDIKSSYKYINNLLLKINNENKKIKIILPSEDKFKYAFINTIQKFNLPGNYRINHNDLSDFCRFFFTYVSLVIEPKKRQSKNTESDTSKYGTYLRYKRISNYENKIKMHLRMLYFLRNFDITDKELIDEISKQFNITLEDSAKELDLVKNKYAKVLEKVRKNLKKIKAMPKSKPPGIGIDIQGRSADKYKIRITGSRSKEQLNEIVSFIKVLIYIYIETYLNKKPKYQKIKTTLEKLNKIAKRRNKVKEIVNYDESTSTVKDITSLDKKRLGFRPEEGQNQWTRSCQNSGDNKKRRPLIVSSNNVKELLKRGYKMNPKTNFYEKTVVQKNKGKSKEITVRAVKLTGEDGNFNFYTCDPDENKEHTFIGFLSKSNNPNDLCMPCCFKKDQMFSDNKEKKNYYRKCIGEKGADEKVEKEVVNTLGDKIYILQDTNKIQEGRFIFLPQYLNKFFNTVWKNDNVIKNHYLIESNSGFYFKFTVKDNYYHFLAAMANIFDKSIDQIKELCIKKILENNNIFPYLNNGDIKTMFSKEQYIEYIKNSNYLEYDILGELLAIPNVLTNNGIIYFILEKKIKIIKKQLEKDEIIENYYIKCLNPENNYQINEDRDFVILIKDGKYYFPIYRVRKHKKLDKNIFLQKKFNKNDKDTEKVVNELLLYYNKSCLSNYINNIYSDVTLSCKNIIEKLKSTKIITQVLDTRNKVKYIQLENNFYMPTISSGSHLNYPVKSMNDINFKNILKIDDVIKKLSNINKILNLDFIPTLIYYNKIASGSKPTYNVTSILLKNKLIIPVKEEYMNTNQFKKFGLSYEYQPLESKINDAINNSKENSDGRDMRIRNIMYKNEGYNLFRLEMSLYFENNKDIKNNIYNILKNENIKRNNKRKEILEILIIILNIKLEKQIIVSVKKDSIIEISKELPNLKNYSVSNIRDYCKIHKTKEKCNENLHCVFVNNTCKFNIFQNYGIEYINRLLEEIIQNDIKFKEIMQEDDYYVSDIVDYTQYTDKPNQKIIKTTNFNIKKIMSELFGKNSIPNLGKRRINKSNSKIEEDFPELVKFSDQYIQEIIPNNDSIIRAYVNSYYWINNPLYDIESRNLNYSSEIQNKITNLFKANMIDYIQNNIHNNEFSKNIKELINLSESKNFFVSAINKLRKNKINTNGLLELVTLSYIFNYSIVVFNNFNNVKYIFSNGMVKVNEKTINKYLDKNKRSNTIFLKFDFEDKNTIPKKIYTIYYL